MVKVHQIYFDAESHLSLEPEYIPYCNNPTTIFFESEVMCKLVERGAHKNCDYFGVVSHKLRNKIKGSKMWGRTIANQSLRDFTPKEFESYIRVAGADIASFATHPPHQVFPWAERYHKGICRAADLLIRKLNYRIYYDAKSFQVIYFNYFVAKPQIYEDFVKTLLRPAIRIMKCDPDVHALCKVNSHYRFPMPEAVTKQTGYDYWPLFPFIAERLINLYLLKNSYKFKFIQW